MDNWKIGGKFFCDADIDALHLQVGNFTKNKINGEGAQFSSDFSYQVILLLQLLIN